MSMRTQGVCRLRIACVWVVNRAARIVAPGVRQVGRRPPATRRSRSAQRRVSGVPSRLSQAERNRARRADVSPLIGMVAARALTRWMENLLFAISPGDPATLVAVAALLAAVGLAACYMPARRAIKADVAGMLR